MRAEVSSNGAIPGVEEVEALLRAAARAGEAMSYAAVLEAFGYGFSRPKMRALCRVLDEVDARAKGRGEAVLAVLVVRQSDGLPGQGWWIGREDHRGAWEGPEAAAYVRAVQGRAFGYWRER